MGKYLDYGIFAVMVGVLTGAVLWLNGGALIYTLDDPYIHLAVAEGIANGTYGVNVGEFSTPSSSIIWPFLLAPFSSQPFFELVPFAINVLFAGLMFELLRRLIIRAEISNSYWSRSLILQALMLSLNAYGLIFTGMEHSLQALVSVTVLYGCIVCLEEKRTPYWFLFAIFLGPLVRYELFAVSLVGVGILAYQHRHLTAFGLLVLNFACIGAFSYFLYTHTQDALPSSVLVKMHMAGEHQTLMDVLKAKLMTVAKLLGKREATGVAIIPAIVTLALLARSWSKGGRLLPLAIGTTVLFGLHCAFGRWGWFGRYEVYALAFILPLAVYVYREPLASFFGGHGRGFAFVTVLSALVIGFPSHVMIYGKTPLASNNIYLQQYQMHRFITEHYKGKVGINDLGWVSFRNKHYVLDYAGLASRQARLMRAREEANWMEKLSSAHDVKLVMIYDRWYAGMIPSNWVRLAELHLDGPRITPADSVVAIYATDAQSAPDIIKTLRDFAKSLPIGSRIEVLPPSL